MKVTLKIMRVLALALLLGTLARVCSAAGQSPSASAPFPAEITIVQPPPRGAGPDIMDVISGTATNAPADAKVVVYAYAGGTWWVQPFANQYATPIREGHWSTPTHLGDIYAALLTKSSWKAPPKLGSLPAVGADILAVHQIGAR